ncbi:hypothetical protein [Carboxylicivirga linearis]|uniref:DUF3592 domain-containing protein n=1 Tax=Carboxylicivirga linearis TaxID=1628157 RepID=A0ABS5JXZ7_9BACT|nr:hypothetical protein [Carboxylicivirga linearis]MBS2099805.1 hypothetical protein [Carboxylicivirga linearis]
MGIEEDVLKWKGIVIYIIGIGAILAFIYGMIEGYYFRRSIAENPRYTIGVTTRFIWLKSGRKIEYSYNVKEQEYKWLGIYKEDIIYPNGRYIVKFSSESPENSKILFNYTVPDTIIEAPSFGWEEWPLDKHVKP